MNGRSQEMNGESECGGAGRATVASRIRNGVLAEMNLLVVLRTPIPLLCFGTQIRFWMLDGKDFASRAIWRIFCEISYMRYVKRLQVWGQNFTWPFFVRLADGGACRQNNLTPRPP